MDELAGQADSTPQILRHPSPTVLRSLGLLTVLASVAFGYVIWRAYFRLERVEMELMIARLFSGAMAEPDNGQAGNPRWLVISLAARNIGAILEAAAAVYVFIAGVIGLRARPRRAAWHLAAAGWIIILASLLTMAGIALLVEWAHYPPVSSKTLLLIGLCQSLFGWVLVLALATLRRG